MKTENRNGLYAVSATTSEISHAAIVQLNGLTMGQWYAKQTDKPDIMINASLWDGKGAIGTIYQNGKLVRNEGTGFGFGTNHSGDFGFSDPWSVEWLDYITGYPALVRDGKQLSDSVDAYVQNSHNKRSVIAAAGNSLYFITADGMTIAQLRNALTNFGVFHAINLDGGGSSRLLVQGKAVNNPSDDRKCPNAIAVWLSGSKTETNEGKDTVKKQLRIAIDAGHGKNTAGKRCLETLDPNETREWYLNQRIATKLADILKASGQDVLRVDDTTGQTDVDLSVRCDKANSWNADAYISIHHDSGIAGGTGGGATVFAYTSPSAKTIELRNTVYDEYIKAGGIKGNRSKPLSSANFHVLRATKMPAILIECGFMDSSTDIPIILSDTFPDKAAMGIANGIANTFGFTVKAGSLPSNTENSNPPPVSEHWAQGRLDSLVKKGVISDPAQWNKFDSSLSTLTIGQLLALIDAAIS